MQDNPQLWRWLRASLAAISIFGFSIFYIIGHLALQVPLHRLVAPFLLQSLFTVLLAPLMYWSRKRQIESGGDLRPFFATIGGYVVVVCVLYDLYLREFGYVSRNNLWESLLLIPLLIVVGSVVGYYLHRRVAGQK